MYICCSLPEKIGGCTARRPAGWLAIALAVACSASTPSAAAEKPNVVVIMSDDAGYNEFGFSAALNGQTTQFETPNLDALANQSVVARQGYVAAPLCSPSRAGLLTGQYQQRFGFEYNLATGPAYPFTDTTGFSADEVTIASHLRNLGYSTGMVGKWHAGYIDGVNVPLDKGFDEFFGTWSGARFYYADFRQANAIRRGDVFYESEYRAGGNPNPNDPDGYDPVNGRYVTDAFGDEASSFVRNHANDSNPFFLYLTPTAPHDPYQAKQQDLNHFANISDSTKRTQAAMTYAMDRAVGKVIQALDDPNNDGNTNDSVRNNTIIVFLNDNGGTSFNDNAPLRGVKGSFYEGGIRVPFMISAPGLQPGVYDAPVSAIDILPTVYAAAGGNVGVLNSDGVNLMPHLAGNDLSDPHHALFFRTLSLWGVRKGDWKLTNPTGGGVVLYNLATDPGETTSVMAQNPDIVTDLVRELTVWEAQLEKPKWGTNFVSPYDHFLFRAQSFGFAFTSSANVWTDPATESVATINQADVYANTILEFPAKLGGNYAVTNNRARLSGQTFMLNEIQLTGTFTTAFNCNATLNGQPYLFVNDLEGNSPKLRLDAVSSGTNARFTFNIDSDLFVLDDLEITGDGTQNFVLHGGISDYWHPRNVRKTGTSTMDLVGNNTFTGDLQIVAGRVNVSGAGAINGANRIVIGSAGTFNQAGGTVAVRTIDNSAGGSFQFTAGELRVVDFVGNLTNQGGNYSPGASPADSTITGNLVQTAPSTKLTMELAGTSPGANYDQLTIDGSATLGGTLQIDLLNGFFQQSGDVYTLLIAIGGVNGTFANTILPALSGGRSWRLVYGASSLHLVIDPTGGWNGIAGDFDRNGKVDAADYVLWRNDLNSKTRLFADGDGDGTVEMDDFQIWRANFGNSAPATSSGVLAGVPEPSTILLALLAFLSAAGELRRRARAPSATARACAV